MATYEVTGPDGHKYRVTGPDGASDADVLAQVQAHAQAPSAGIPFDPSAGGGTLSIGPFDTGIQTPEFLDRGLAGAGKALTDIGQGIKERFGQASQADVAAKRATDAPLMNTTAGKIGDVVGTALPALPAMMVPGVNTIAGAGALGTLQGLAQPTAQGESVTKNAMLGGILGGAGQGVGNAIGGALSRRAVAQAADLGAKQTANTVRDATLKTAQDAGYVLPPSQVNPSIANRFAEGFAGKLTTAQSAAMKNQNVTNNLIKRELGIPADQPLTMDAIEAVRNDAANAGYAPVRNFGTIAPDEGYANELMDIAGRYDKSHGGMNSMRNSGVESLLKDASSLGDNGQLDSNAAVELIRSLRQQGKKNQSFTQDAPKQQLGQTQVGIANAMENLIERKMADAGQTDAVQAFRAARQKMAQTYDVENAFNPATGNVQASKLASLLQKEKPLTGGLKTVAEAGAAFPKATQEIKSSMPGVSPLDFVAAMLGGSINPAGLGAVVARPAARAGILSQGYQKAMVQPPSYSQSALNKLLASNPDELKQLLGLLGGVGTPAVAR